MNQRTCVLSAWTALAVALVVATPACADVLYETGFEPPDFVAGQPVDGQSEWVARASSAAGTISDVDPISGKQSLRVEGAGLELSSEGFLEGVYRHSRLYDADQIRAPFYIQVDARLEGPVTGPPIIGDLISANLNVFTAEGEVASIILSSDGHVYAFTQNAAYQFQTEIEPQVPHTLALEVDFDQRMSRFFVDDTLMGTLPFSPAIQTRVFVVNLPVIGLDDPRYDPADYVATYDNYSVSTVQ